MYHRSKRRLRYRNEIQDVFNPSLKTANVPNYYQMKGRTIQQTPLKMRNNDTQIITRKELEKMYDKLIKYKFPIPNNERCPIYMTIVGKISDVFSGNPLVFTAENLETIANTFMQQKYSMLLASGNWHYECIGIQFLNNEKSSIDYGKRYWIDWHIGIVPNGYIQIMSKGNDDAITTGATSLILNSVPETSNTLSVIRTAISLSSKFGYYEETVANSDPSSEGKALYTLLNSGLPLTDPCYGYFEYNIGQGEITDLSIAFITVAIPD